MNNDDLIRRGDVENALRTDLRDDDATRLASAWALNRLRALPADPRAAAAIRLAKALVLLMNEKSAFADAPKSQKLGRALVLKAATMTFSDALEEWESVCGKPKPEPEPDGKGGAS